LLENAIASNNVLGNKQEGEEEPEEPGKIRIETRTITRLFASNSSTDIYSQRQKLQMTQKDDSSSGLIMRTIQPSIYSRKRKQPNKKRKMRKKKNKQKMRNLKMTLRRHGISST
jgi:hypothetical protein